MEESSDSKVIGKYELLEVVGTGAQGQVWKAKCLEDINEFAARGDIVAIKILSNRGSADEMEEKRFMRQVSILEHLNHPGICHYIDYFIDAEGEFNERRCLVMEYLDGTPLDERLKRYPKGLPWDEVQVIFQQCIDGLAHAAELNIFHRDLKPSNIYITNDGKAKLIDFGIARQEGGEETSTAGWRGSFDYMAPDFVAIEGFRGDERSDVFSLGICFYKALTGVLPFDPFGDNAHIGYLNRWKEDDPPRPSFRHNTFRVLTRAKPFILGSLNPDRDERYNSFVEMSEALAKVTYRLVRHRNKDDYELIDVLGRGGFGEVFKGRIVSNGKLVAIKHLFAGRQASRFIKEAQLLAKYNHPDIVEYVDFIEVEGLGDDKEFFLVMEYLPGMPGSGLNQRIRRAKTGLEPAEVIEIFIHYLMALQFLHENPRPIIHRDVKPGNLYAPPGQPQKAKMFDLGVARDVSGTLTTGMIPGTLDYMAPEFAKPGSDRGTPQSDIYAMGVTFYEALVGTKPLPRLPKADQEAFVEFVARSQNPPEVEYRHQVFQEVPMLAAICRKSMTPQPENRYASAGEMLADLKALMAEIAGEDEDDLHDSPTRATIADPALIERLKAHAAGQPAFIPPSEIETILKEPDMAVQERPEWLEETDSEPTHDSYDRGSPSAPYPPATGAGTAPATGAATYAPTAGAPAGSHAVKIAAIAAVIVALLVGGGIFMFLSMREVGPEQVRTAFVETIKEYSVPQADDAYVRRLMTQLAMAREKKVSDETYEVWWDNQIAEISDIAEKIPAAFSDTFTQAMTAKDRVTAGAVAASWQNIGDAAIFMGLTEREYIGQGDEMREALEQFEFSVAVSEVETGLPEAIDSPSALAAVEAKAASFRGLRDTSWDSVPGDVVKQAFDRLASRFAGLATGYFEAEQARLVAGFQGGEDATRQAAADFKGLAEGAPSLVAMGEVAYGEALTAVDDAQTLFERTRAMEASLNELRSAVPEQVASIAEVTKAEEAALAYRAAVVRPWDGVSESDKAAMLDPIRDELVGQLNTYIGELEKTALAQYKALAKTAPEDDALRAIGEAAPNLVAMLGGTYAAAVSRLDAAQGDRDTELAQIAQDAEAAKRKAAEEAAMAATEAEKKAREAEIARNRNAFDEATTELEDALPAAVTKGTLGAAETAAEALAAFAVREFPDVPMDERDAVAAEAESTLARLASAYVSELEANATAKFNAMEAVVPEWDQLKAFRETSPTLANLVNGAVDSAILNAEAALRKRDGSNAFTDALDAMGKLIPARVTNAATLGEAEEAARALADMESKKWEVVSADEVKTAQDRIRETLTRKVESYISALELQGVGAYEKMEDGEPYRKALAALESGAPRLFALAGDTHPSAVAALDAAAEAQAKRRAFVEAVAAVDQSLPARITGEAELKAAETAATRLGDARGKAWDGIADAERDETLGERQDVLTGLLAAYVKSLSDDALGAFRKREDGSAAADALSAIPGAAPALSALVQEPLDTAIAEVAAARNSFEAMAKFTDSTGRIQAAIPASIGGPADVAQAEKAARAFEAVRGRDWAGVADREKSSVFAEIRVSLLAGGTAYIDGLRTSAVTQYETLTEGDPAEAGLLKALETEAPTLVAMVDTLYDGAVQAVDAARVKKEKRVEGEMAAAAAAAAAKAAAEAEEMRLAALRAAEEKRLAALRAAEQDRMQVVENAWDQVQNAWATDAKTDLSAAYKEVFEASFELPQFASTYTGIREALLKGVQDRIGGAVESAERSIAAYRAYRYQVSYPPEGAYRVIEGEEIPGVSFNLPQLEDVEGVELGISRAGMVRLSAWRKASDAIADEGDLGELIEILEKMADASRKQGDLELAGLCTMESMLLQSEPAVFPGVLEKLGEPAEIFRWRAHALYQGQRSELEVLSDMEKYVSRKGALNEYDLRLVLFASYYSWRNAIEGEKSYAARVRKSLAAVIEQANKPVSTAAMDFLIEYIEGGADDETEFPGLYMVTALTFMDSSSPLATEAEAWLKANGGTYQPRLDRIRSQSDLLKRLLEP